MIHYGFGGVTSNNKSSFKSFHITSSDSPVGLVRPTSPVSNIEYVGHHNVCAEKAFEAPSNFPSTMILLCEKESSSSRFRLNAVTKVVSTRIVKKVRGTSLEIVEENV